MRPLHPVPDGIYDNIATCCREVYDGGELVLLLDRRILCYMDNGWLSEKWGHYKDIPRHTPAFREFKATKITFGDQVLFDAAANKKG